MELERNNEDSNLLMRYRAMEFIQNTQTDFYKICLAILCLYHDGEQRTSISESSRALYRIDRELNHNMSDMISRGLSPNPADRPISEASLSTT